jgi:cytochrome c
MRFCKLMGLALLLSLGGCGGEQGGSGAEPSKPLLTAATLGEQTLRSNDEWLAMAPYATADMKKGEQQAMLCMACHSLQSGGATMIGPNLYGFFGSKVASREDFSYTAALNEADFYWTPRALDAWLEQPAKFLPGNMMSFPGVRKQQDRDNLIAYLLEVTGE